VTSCARAQSETSKVSSNPQGISSELSFGEVISKTFELYRREFLNFVILFAIFEATLGVLGAVVREAYPMTTLPTSGTPQQIDAAFIGYFGALFAQLALIGIITWVFYPLIYGSAVKMASDEINGEKVNIARSFRVAVSKLLWMWGVGIVVGIITILGLIALVVPGIILAIMFSLVIPVIIIENEGFGSMGRSRELVGHRWGKTLVLFLIFGIILFIAEEIVSLISRPLGAVGSTIASSILSAFYLPLIPILLTVYYYSNRARIAPPPMAPYPPPPPPPTVAWPSPPATGTSPPQWSQTMTCPKCGAQAAQDAIFCPSCGSRLRQAV
jgi:hypothetical protein